MLKAIIAKNYEKLTEPVGSGSCAALVQHYGCNLAAKWRAGATVKGNSLIAKGTCVATFDDNGRYPNKPTGNHAAIYISQDASGVRVYDQWDEQSPHYRQMDFEPGRTNTSNNGNCLSVILTTPFTQAPGYKDAVLADDPRPSAQTLALISAMTDPVMKDLLIKVLDDEVLSFQEVALIHGYVLANRRNLAGYSDLVLILSLVRTIDPMGRHLLTATMHACVQASSASSRPRIPTLPGLRALKSRIGL